MSVSEKIIVKIEEIRSKPEHIKLRYVWGAVAFSMLFILLIWIFSLNIFFKKNLANPNSNNAVIDTLQEQMGDLKNKFPEKPSIENFNTEELLTDPESPSSLPELETMQDTEVR